MSIKVVKFGGSSLADADKFRRVAEIIAADPDRRYVVPSAPGKRFSDDIKITDMLYQCYNLAREASTKEEFETCYNNICARFYGIIADLGLDFDISGELTYIKNAILGLGRNCVRRKPFGRDITLLGPLMGAKVDADGA